MNHRGATVLLRTTRHWEAAESAVVVTAWPAATRTAPSVEWRLCASEDDLLSVAELPHGSTTVEIAFGRLVEISGIRLTGDASGTVRVFTKTLPLEYYQMADPSGISRSDGYDLVSFATPLVCSELMLASSSGCLAGKALIIMSKEYFISSANDLISYSEGFVFERLVTYSEEPYYGDMGNGDFFLGRKGNCAHAGLWLAFCLRCQGIPLKVVDVKSTDVFGNQFSHVMVECIIGNQPYVVDALNGWVYEGTVIELKTSPRAPLNCDHPGRTGCEFYRTIEFLSRIHRAAAYLDLSYTGLFVRETHQQCEILLDEVI